MEINTGLGKKNKEKEVKKQKKQREIPFRLFKDNIGIYYIHGKKKMYIQGQQKPILKKDKPTYQSSGVKKTRKGLFGNLNNEYEQNRHRQLQLDLQMQQIALNNQIQGITKKNADNTLRLELVNKKINKYRKNIEELERDKALFKKDFMEIQEKYIQNMQQQNIDKNLNLEEYKNVDQEILDAMKKIKERYDIIDERQVKKEIKHKFYLTERDKINNLIDDAKQIKRMTKNLPQKTNIDINNAIQQIQTHIDELDEKINDQKQRDQRYDDTEDSLQQNNKVFVMNIKKGLNQQVKNKKKEQKQKEKEKQNEDQDDSIFVNNQDEKLKQLNKQKEEEEQKKKRRTRKERIEQQQQTSLSPKEQKQIIQKETKQQQTSISPKNKQIDVQEEIKQQQDQFVIEAPKQEPIQKQLQILNDVRNIKQRSQKEIDERLMNKILTNEIQQMFETFTDEKKSHKKFMDQYQRARTMHTSVPQQYYKVSDRYKDPQSQKEAIKDISTHLGLLQMNQYSNKLQQQIQKIHQDKTGNLIDTSDIYKILQLVSKGAYDTIKGQKQQQINIKAIQEIIDNKAQKAKDMKSFSIQEQSAEQTDNDEEKQNDNLSDDGKGQNHELSGLDDGILRALIEEFVDDSGEDFNIIFLYDHHHVPYDQLTNDEKNYIFIFLIDEHYTCAIIYNSFDPFVVSYLNPLGDQQMNRTQSDISFLKSRIVPIIYPHHKCKYKYNTNELQNGGKSYDSNLCGYICAIFINSILQKENYREASNIDDDKQLELFQLFINDKEKKFNYY